MNLRAAGTPAAAQDLPEVLVLHPRGDLDTVTAPALRQGLLELLGRNAKLVVVDMTDVGFLDSAGLAALVGVHRDLPSGQQIALANVPPRMQRALHIAAVATLFLVHLQGQPWPGPDLPLPEPK